MMKASLIRKMALVLPLLIVAALFLWFSGRDGQPTLERTKPRASTVSTEQPEALPPSGPEGYAYANRRRLDDLAAAPGYRGPSYKEDYTQPEWLMAARKRPSERQPAGNERK